MKVPNPELMTDHLDIDEVRSLQALSRGEATANQQTVALSVIVKKLCRSFDLPYVAGDTHASAFLAGRAYGGLQITKFVKTPVTVLFPTEKKPNA